MPELEIGARFLGGLDLTAHSMELASGCGTWGDPAVLTLLVILGYKPGEAGSVCCLPIVQYHATLLCAYSSLIV